MPSNNCDLIWMNLAIQLAKKGNYTTQPNPRVGCVIVKDKQLISQGWHKKAGGNHAEINAINNARQASDVIGADVFINLEPCAHHGKTPPCVPALIKAKVARVIIAMLDPNPLVAGKGVTLLKQAGIKVELGLLADSAKQLNLGFISRFTKKIPLVTIKLAMSLDGRTAMASGESQWITAKPARYDVQKLRAASGAIITGINTIQHDNPSLSVRDFKTGRQPIRVILDSNLQIKLDAKIFQDSAKVVIFSLQINAYKKSLLENMAVTVVQVNAKNKQIDLLEVLTWLANNEINNVLVEAGAKLSASFINHNLVDELIIYLAPKLLGAKAKPLFELPFNLMNEAIDLQLKDLRHLGKDIKLTWQVKNNQLKL